MYLLVSYRFVSKQYNLRQSKTGLNFVII